MAASCRAGSADQPPSGGNGNPHWHRTSRAMGDTGGRPGPQPNAREGRTARRERGAKHSVAIAQAVTRVAGTRRKSGK